MGKIDDNADRITALIHQATVMWLNDIVFTWRWWLAFMLTFMPWLLWLIYRKKNSADRLLYVALTVMMVSVILNVVGDQFGLWHYRYNLVPIMPTYFPWDFTVLPVAVITALQIKPRANPWLKGAIFASVSAFVGEPFFQWIGVYRLVHWRPVYSLPIYVAIYMLANWMLVRRNRFAPLDDTP
ncbi:hypothetical protein SD70_01515 [Gordoniibacillus kamchatkensis]|uniref:Uncharacterized protein n=1 Tax=Gordoniibacillus kamchatkensis TaxID=1590651 RepID=A0ABR5AN11_9BACL|nr:hypothetical protein SD70_01515 [Paenibacillus sp. VKM B-2647]